MKTSAIGIVSAAVLLVVAGIGFGIAQAGEDHSNRPVLSIEDQAALDQSDSSESYAGNHSDRPVLSIEDQAALDQSDSSEHIALVPPSAIDLDYAADDTPPSVVAQGRGPVETGAVPATGGEESWMRNYGND
jgi:hypothetical protein